jgi:hypothetical protein
MRACMCLQASKQYTVLTVAAAAAARVVAELRMLSLGKHIQLQLHRVLSDSVASVQPRLLEHAVGIAHTTIFMTMHYDGQSSRLRPCNSVMMVCCCLLTRAAAAMTA